MKLKNELLADADLAGIVGGMHHLHAKANLGGGNAVSVNPLITRVHLSGPTANAVANALNGAAAALHRVPPASAALAGVGALVGGMNASGKGVTITTLTAMPGHGPFVILPRK